MEIALAVAVVEEVTLVETSVETQDVTVMVLLVVVEDLTLLLDQH